MPRPFILLNMAMTADGKIATANRAVSSFGSPVDQEHLFALRATADAVMAGARTIDAAPVALGTGGEKFCRRRLRHGLARHNLRVIVSGGGTINPSAEIFRHRFSPIIILTTERAPAAQLKRLRELADEVKICGARDIDLAAAFAWLHDQWQVRRLVCEGGGGLNDALFQARLIDEFHLTICPKIFGGRNAPTVAEGVGAKSLAAAASFQLTSMKRVGPELFAVFSSAEGLPGAENPGRAPKN